MAKTHTLKSLKTHLLFFHFFSTSLGTSLGTLLPQKILLFCHFYAVFMLLYCHKNKKNMYTKSRILHTYFCYFYCYFAIHFTASFPASLLPLLSYSIVFKCRFFQGFHIVFNFFFIFYFFTPKKYSYFCDNSLQKIKQNWNIIFVLFIIT